MSASSPPSSSSYLFLTHHRNNSMAFGGRTLSKLVRLLRHQPVPGLDVDELEAREEAAYGGQHLVRDVLALRAANEERRLLEPRLVRVTEGEVAQVVERLGQDVQWYGELVVRAALWTPQVA
jgi:hypothetical protein